MEAMNKDTHNLLKECNFGIQMGVSAIDELLSSVKHPQMKKIIERSRNEHVHLGDETHKMLNEAGKPIDEPNAMVKTMSWLKLNGKYALNPTDHEIADLLTNGCNMGVKSINKYLNQYPLATYGAKSIAENLSKLEERLSVDMRPYL